MIPGHEAKVDELIKNMAKTLKTTCERLYKSGGIDIGKYSPDNYALARILLTAAMKDCKDHLRPFSDDFREDLKNLQRF